MEVDKGATVSIISKATYQKLFSEVSVKPASLRLRTYTGGPITVAGEMITQVKYGSQTKELGLIVVQGDGPNMFGRNWLDHFQLDWKIIGLAMLENSQARNNALKRHSQKVMKHFQAKLRVHIGITPVSHRPCPVPFAVKDAIERESYGIWDSKKGDA